MRDHAHGDPPEGPDVSIVKVVRDEETNDPSDDADNVPLETISAEDIEAIEDAACEMHEESRWDDHD